MGKPSLLGDEDLYLFNEGGHLRLYEKLGAHPLRADGEEGTYFAVWAPNAARVSVIGDFNGWDADSHPLRSRGTSGIWEGFVPGVGPGSRYKYRVASRLGGRVVDKTDPFAFHTEVPPRTASTVWSLDYDWRDQEWMASRAARARLDAPMSIYEVHLGSWRSSEGGDRRLGYRELAPLLADHVREMGFTHVEFLPLMEHPFYGSWGYQTTGYFAPSSRYGTPQDLMFLIDYLHQHDIGVILDWVPSHFPTDEHGLGYFDGTHLYEHARSPAGISSGLEQLHLQLRPATRSAASCSAARCSGWTSTTSTACESMPSHRCSTCDYSRKEGEWIPNEHGGRENLEAIDFLRRAQREVYATSPSVQTFAEESTAWPMVSRPTYLGGLGFGLKWDMGWMHDTLELHVPRSRPSQVPPQRADLPDGLRVPRELRAAALARRGGSRQRLAAGEDAR